MLIVENLGNSETQKRGRRKKCHSNLPTEKPQFEMQIYV